MVHFQTHCSLRSYVSTKGHQTSGKNFCSYSLPTLTTIRKRKENRSEEYLDISIVDLRNGTVLPSTRPKMQGKDSIEVFD